MLFRPLSMTAAAAAFFLAPAAGTNRWSPSISMDAHGTLRSKLFEDLKIEINPWRSSVSTTSRRARVPIYSSPSLKKRLSLGTCMSPPRNTSLRSVSPSHSEGNFFDEKGNVVRTRINNKVDDYFRDFPLGKSSTAAPRRSLPRSKYPLSSLPTSSRTAYTPYSWTSSLVLRHCHQARAVILEPPPDQRLFYQRPLLLVVQIQIVQVLQSVQPRQALPRVLMRFLKLL